MAEILRDDLQYHIHLRPGDPGKYVLLPGDPGRCKQIAAYLEHAKETACNREYCTYTGLLDGERVSVTSTGIGGPSLAIALQELVKAGADTFIRVGTCGGMQPQVLAGDVVIAQGAIRMEGTSREYLPIEFPAVADFQVTGALAAAAAELGQRHHIGVVECKDSFYGQQAPEEMPVGYELLNKWKAWIAGGALMSEMESAALFTVAAFLRVRAGTVSLVLQNQERRRLGLEDAPVPDGDAAIQVAIRALRDLIARDRANPRGADPKAVV